MPANPLLIRFSSLLEDRALEGPILDLACGTGENGLFLAGMDLPVVLADRSAQALAVARSSAQAQGLEVDFWEIDLETGGNPLPEEHYRAILVFHYLHRPLIPAIRGGIREEGILIYETFTSQQPKYGRPRNPDHLLQPGELADWFKDWQVIHYFEGLLDDPLRAMAQIVCRKPRRGRDRPPLDPVACFGVAKGDLVAAQLTERGLLDRLSDQQLPQLLDILRVMAQPQGG